MTARTRYLFIASILVLTVGVGTGLVAYYVGQPAGSRGAGPAELQLIPQAAIVVTYANVREVMGSPLHQNIRQMVPLQEERRRQFEEATGINLETDIDRIVACLGPQGAGNAPATGLLIARGRFNEVKLEALMRDHGAQVEAYNGKRLLIGPATARQDNNGKDDTDGSNPLVVSFVEPGLVAIGTPTLVRAAIDLQRGGRSVTSNTEVMQLVRSVDGSSAWAVGRFDALRSTVRLPAALTDRLPAITLFSLSGHVGNDLTGVVRAEARDEDAANNLRDVARGLVALARLQAAANGPLRAIVQSLKLGGEGKTVSLSFAVSGDVLGTLGPGGRVKAERGH
jgi:hypothetical protein